VTRLQTLGGAACAETEDARKTKKSDVPWRKRITSILKVG
jgi:hypothetical protein